jgi:hypothetical protein
MIRLLYFFSLFILYTAAVETLPIATREVSQTTSRNHVRKFNQIGLTVIN